MEAPTLTALRELILNSTADLKVMAMGCGSGLMPAILTLLLKKRQRVGDWVTVTFGLICHADIPAISWFTKLQPMSSLFASLSLSHKHTGVFYFFIPTP